MADRHSINLSTAWCPQARAWVRRFGRPEGIEPGNVLWLVVESAVGCRLDLNAVPLSAVEPGGVLRHEVTGQLSPRNELRVSPLDSGAAWPAGEPVPPSPHGRLPLPEAIARVRLEIESRSPGGSTDLP
jgi:hypothetical protein